MTAQDIAARAVAFLLVIGGTGLCVLIFMGLAAMGHFWRMNDRPDDEGLPPPRSWLHREDGE